MYFKPLSASLPSNVSSISNHFKIIKMCSLSTPLVKTQKAFSLGRNKWYRQDGLALPDRHSKGWGENIFLCKVFRHYWTLERVWVIRSAVNPNTPYYLLQSGILHFPFCCLHGIIGRKQTDLIISETSDSIILPQHLLIINALPNIQCFHWLKAHT